MIRKTIRKSQKRNIIPKRIFKKVRFSDDRTYFPLKYYLIFKTFSFIIKAHLPNQLNHVSKNVLIICLIESEVLGSNGSKNAF